MDLGGFCASKGDLAYDGDWFYDVETKVFENENTIDKAREFYY